VEVKIIANSLPESVEDAGPVNALGYSSSGPLSTLGSAPSAAHPLGFTKSLPTSPTRRPRMSRPRELIRSWSIRVSEPTTPKTPKTPKAPSICVGVTTADLNVAEGESARLQFEERPACWLYGSDGTKHHRREAKAFGASFGEGDTVGILLDTYRQDLSFYLNGTLQGTGPAFGHLPFAHLRLVIEVAPGTDTKLELEVGIPPVVRFLTENQQ